MLQKYKNILIHINMFQELYNMKEAQLHFQEMDYRHILDYLYSRYNLTLLENENKCDCKIIESLGFYEYFQNIYTPSKEIYRAEDFSSIMQRTHFSDNKSYLTIGRNTNMEIEAAMKCYIDTCMIIEDYCLHNVICSTYQITSLEKVKTII